MASPNTSQLTVAVRIRPLNDMERQKKAFQCVYPLDEQRVLLVDPEKFENNVLRQNRQHERQFTFDASFGPTSTHSEVHAKTTNPLVDFVVEGYNATVFAYGPTGSGKTYTMVGNREKPGLMNLLLATLYDKINPDEYTVYISFLEIYNEVIRDLLNPNTSNSLDLLEDEKGNVQVPGLSRVKAPDSNKIMQILQEGNSHRTQEPTAANLSSSRSHALLQVTLYKHSVQHGKLFLIDLAGSERASQTQNKGRRLKEGASINKSLLALGNVINALSSGSKAKYVNYRDSKLTRLLKDSLGGNSKTCMIAHVTPSSSNYDETYNTLVYANRAKNITTRLVLNMKRPASADLPYTEAIQEIKKEATRRTNIPHASSFNQLSNGHQPSPSHHQSNEQPPSTTVARWTTNGKATTNNHNNNAQLNGKDRRFSSLFSSLKEQYLANCEKQQRLRQRLLKANIEMCDVEMNRSSKISILMAWEKRSQEEEEKYSDIIERIKSDTNEQAIRLSQLQDIRQKVERTLRKNSESMKSLESRMRAVSREAQQTEFIDLLVRMAEKDAEKMAATSDSALQNLRMRRQETSLQKIQKYEQIADKLISSDLTVSERAALQQEYRVIKNQLNYHLVPLKMSTTNMVSWNSQVLQLQSNTKILPREPFPTERGPRSSIPNDLDFGKTFVSRNKTDFSRLPEIQNTESTNSIAGESQSDYGTTSGNEELSETTHRLPTIH